MAQLNFGAAAAGANIFTPLGFATFHDQSHIVELLLQAGADPQQTFEFGGKTFTPVQFAEEKGKKRTLRTLQTFKPKVSATTSTAAAPSPAPAPAPKVEEASVSLSNSNAPASNSNASSNSNTPSVVAAAAPRRAPVAAAERTLILFPGQGAQKVGMGSTLDEKIIGPMLEKARQVLQWDVWRVCREGPESELQTTRVSQVALYVTSMCAWEMLRHKEPQRVDGCVALCGLSLGEYTALAAAGVVTFEEGLRLVKARAEAMQKAADMSPSGMVSVLGLNTTAEKVAELCAHASRNSGEKVFVSNALCLGNTVVSGSLKACDEVMKLAESYGATKTVKLAVAGAFHSEFMRPAFDELKAVLETVTFKPPQIPVVFNVDGQEETDPNKIKQKLLDQLVKPVLWEKSILYCLEKFELAHVVEVGPGNVLTGLMRRILKEFKGDKKPNPKATNA